MYINLKGWLDKGVCWDLHIHRHLKETHLIQQNTFLFDYLEIQLKCKKNVMQVTLHNPSGEQLVYVSVRIRTRKYATKPPTTLPYYSTTFSTASFLITAVVMKNENWRVNFLFNLKKSRKSCWICGIWNKKHWSKLSGADSSGK